MSIFHGRSQRPDPFLAWKVRIFTVAAVLGLGGMYFEERWMGAGAIALLAVAMALRLVPRARRGTPPDEDEDGSGAEPDPRAGVPEGDEDR
jgi:hypothetical protein